MTCFSDYPVGGEELGSTYSNFQTHKIANTANNVNCSKCPLVMLKILSIILVLNLFKDSNGRKLPDIYWNSTNEIFDISNTDHVKQVRLLDRVTIICPLPQKDPKVNVDYEYSKLYMVSREEYDSCELYSNRMLGLCATPDRHSSISIVFRDFSPIPSAFEFHPGQSYYIIATSNGTEPGLNNTFGGLCLLRNMRLKFEVLKNEESTEATPVTVGSKTRNLDNHKQIIGNNTGSKKPHTTTTNSNQNDGPQESITYIIHTVEPEHFTVAHSLRSQNAPDSASSLLKNLNIQLVAILFLFLVDMGWRRGLF